MISDSQILSTCQPDLLKRLVTFLSRLIFLEIFAHQYPAFVPRANPLRSAFHFRPCQSVWEGMKQDPKTLAAVRDVDLCPALADMLKEFVGERRTGLLFVNRSGRPLAQSNVLRRSLHPLLKELKTEKAGFHSFRRFRATHLRKNRVPEDLLRFWLGHANKTITDDYSKVKDDVAFRDEVACEAGLGFALESPIVRNVRRREEAVEVVIVATGKGLEWRARRDSNPRPSGSKPDALSS